VATGLRKLVETVTGPLDQKRRYRQYKARIDRLPASHRAAAEALLRYSNYFGAATAEGGLSMLGDLVDLFEQAAANGTPVREIVGEDPVEFAEEFLRNYAKDAWINRERKRLTEAITRAEKESP
jgi:DNA-binding ferritin-like protein (Dps family)